MATRQPDENNNTSEYEIETENERNPMNYHSATLHAAANAHRARYLARLAKANTRNGK
jgi:hypothetical protein